MDMVIVNGSLITGDGITFLEKASVRIRGTKIVDVMPYQVTANEGDRIIDAGGAVVLPGIINAHAHGCIAGPSMPSGSLPLSAQDISYQRNRHLLSGTTTLLNVCGLATPDEIGSGALASHALDVQVSTAHTPSSLGAARVSDGAGLSAHHLSATIDDMLARGAKALGEAGGGQTLGGGAQDYRYLPQAIEQATGVTIHPKIARLFKEAVLGRRLDGAAAASNDGLEALLDQYALIGHLTAAQLRGIVVETVMPPVHLAMRGLSEIAAQSERVGMAAIFHNAAPTAATLVQLAEAYPRARMIAGHSNHPMFLPEEALTTARLLKERGVTIDVSTLDCITTRWRNGPENLDLLATEGVIDTLSTDYAGGDWDTILSAIQRMIAKKQMPAPRAVALATGNVAKAIPELAGDRGLIEKSKQADIVICDAHNLARVRHVIAKGRLVIENCRIL
ncbi:amidohydrolase family protein [Ensifer sp. ENS10]|uniref:amidohydrolase family protein n=1 Tax=Ensifer sp. ENS10 TaxID=2769286 RepID=UPI0017877BAC|nr:amidohydrolase family protein [Ensifer sp. ENS10]MBD9512125.1 amidohydrolase family protein [Ensifer sp. ENS10]